MSDITTIQEAGQARPAPRVWLLTGHKAGDNNQVLAVAEALQWPYEIKRLAYHPWELLTNRLLGETLAGIDPAGSSTLEPPWPDLIITAGRRNEPVARWIRARSGARSRLVHLGRPWAPLHCFDLIAVTPQYFLPGAANVLQIDLPLHRVTREGLDAVAEEWAVRFRHLSRPFWTVLLGGDSGPFVFTESKARRLAGWLNEHIQPAGGSVLVTDSARTPAAAYRAFLDALQVPVSAYHWNDKTAENPYLAYLALADRLVVTGESMSMLTEATVTAQPLFIFDLSDCPGQQGKVEGRCRPWWTLRHNFRYKPLSHRIAMRIAPRRMRRDVTRIQERLIEHGRAVWVGQVWAADSQRLLVSDLEQVVKRIRALF